MSGSASNRDLLTSANKDDSEEEVEEFIDKRSCTVAGGEAKVKKAAGCTAADSDDNDYSDKAMTK